jgi:hypothetical protein
LLTLALYQTWVGNELVVEAESGGVEIAPKSVRRGLVAVAMGKPAEWLTGSVALTLNRAEYVDGGPDGERFVPEVPSVLLRTDVSLHSDLAQVNGREIEARLGLGSTYIAGRHYSDVGVSPAVFVLNATAGARYGWAELGVDVYNLLGLRYADDEIMYESNWSPSPVPRAPSTARHFSAAAPFTILGTLAIHIGS